MQILGYALALWLGLHLLSRDFHNPRLRYTALGLLSYAIIIALSAVTGTLSHESALLLISRLQWALLVFPALFWTGAILHLDPQPTIGLTIWRWFLIPLAVLTALALISLDVVWSPDGSWPGAVVLIPLGVISLTPLLATLITFEKIFQPLRTRNAIGALIVAAMFFALGSGLLLIPLDWLPRSWLNLGIGLDLALLGVAIAWLDAFDEGEAFLPDFKRSFVVTALVAVVFGGQVGIVIALHTGITTAMLTLLLTIIAAAIFVVVFAESTQLLSDRLTFTRRPDLRRARAELRGMANAIPRLSNSQDLKGMDSEEFARLIRRALSHYADLPRLASSPLTWLPQIEARLSQRGISANTLERASELKALLSESVERLKPRGPDRFGSSDEWRYYNVLYFPYIQGLRPYSRRIDMSQMDETERKVIEWFLTSVPERTLYNWQTAGSQLVARDLFERNFS